jgi:hypothetical protein
MTEVEWLTSPDPGPMLTFVNGKVSDGKLRLFACQCCRRIWHLLDEAARQAVACAERYSSGRGVSKGQLKKAHNVISPRRYAYDSPQWYAARAAQNATAVSMTAPHGSYLFRQAAGVAYLASLAVIPLEQRNADYQDWAFGPARRQEQAVQAALLRCILPGPCRPSTIAPICFTPAVISLVDAITDQCASSEDAPNVTFLAILADALEEAGGAEQALLDHLRSPGPHVRGCWPLDLLLGRS